MVKHGKRYYKGMAMEVAVRNPERYSEILNVFSRYDGIVLNDENILNIFVELYRSKVLDSNKVDMTKMDVDQIKKYIIKNVSHNNEWGFPTGYQAAFCRYLKTLSEFGFIYSQYNKKLLISDVGMAIIKNDIDLSEGFALQSVKFWRKSPYRRVANDFNFFDFIIQVLKERKKANKCLSMSQFFVSLFSDDGNVEDFIKEIEKAKIGNSNEKAYKYILSHYNEIDENHSKVQKIETAFNDYGNSVFRILQLTGFITINYKGILTFTLNDENIPLFENLKRLAKPLTEEEKEDAFLYFQKIGKINKEELLLIKKYRHKKDSSNLNYESKLKNIVNDYKLTKKIIKKEILNLIDYRKPGIFWFLSSDALRLEFLTTIFLYLCYGNEFKFKPNFNCDETGIPYKFAGGNMGDIEIFNDKIFWLVEVTLTRNKFQQLNNETINLFRHIATYKRDEKYLTLVAPCIHDDTELAIKTCSLITKIEKKENIYSTCLSFLDFLTISEIKNNLSEMKNKDNEFIKNIKKALNSYR